MRFSEVGPNRCATPENLLPDHFRLAPLRQRHVQANDPQRELLSSARANPFFVHSRLSHPSFQFFHPSSLIHHPSSLIPHPFLFIPHPSSLPLVFTRIDHLAAGAGAQGLEG